MIKAVRHIFDGEAAHRSVLHGGWFCSCGCSFEDLDELIWHVDEVIPSDDEPGEAVAK